jgi:hypothetical protein
MTAAHGQMFVSTFPVGRVFDGGCCDIGWSRSMDRGRTWQTGLLPLTIFGGQVMTDAGPLTRDNALAERMLTPTCGLRIGSDTSVLPVTKPHGGRAPVPRPSLHRTAC